MLIEGLAIMISTAPFYWLNPEWTNKMPCDIKTLSTQYCIYFIMLPIVVSSVIMIALYGRIFLAAWEQTKKIRVHNISQAGVAANMSKVKELKAAKILSLTLGCYVVCWTPLLVYFGLVLDVNANFVDRYEIGDWCLLLAMSNSGVNVVIYGLLSPVFRAAFKKICCRCKVHYST